MHTVTRNTTFDLADGTGDYLRIEVALKLVDGKVRVHAITRVLQIDPGKGLGGLLIFGAALARRYERIVKDIEDDFQNDDLKIAAEIAKQSELRVAS